MTIGEIPYDLMSLEQFELRIPHDGSVLSVDVPIGAVRDLWQAGPEVGLALSCEIVISTLSDRPAIFLRYLSR